MSYTDGDGTLYFLTAETDELCACGRPLEIDGSCTWCEVMDGEFDDEDDPGECD